MPLLTVRAVEAFRPKAEPYKITLDRGLQLRIAPDGKRTLLVRYTVKGSDTERQYRLPQEYGDAPGQQALCRLRGSRTHSRHGPTRRRLDRGRGHTARGRGFDACCKSSAPGWTDAGGRAPGLRREEAPCQGRVCTEGTYEVGLPGGDRAASSDQERNKAGCRPPPSDRSQGTGDADGERHSRDIRGSCQALIAASRVRDADSSRGPALERCGHPRQPARSRDCGPRSHHYHDRKGRSDAHPARAPRGVVARRREGAVAGRV